MEYESLVQCPLCGGELRTSGVAIATSAALHRTQSRCIKCGLLLANPRASEETRDRYYDQAYYQEQWPNAEQVFAENIDSRTGHDFNLLRSVAGPMLPAGGRALDVGCGYGAMLEILSRHGYDAVGCEVSGHACAFARSKGLRVVRAKTPCIPFGDATWDLVTSSHVIEHLPDPHAFVQELVRLLKPGGCLALVTDHATATQHFVDRTRARLMRRDPPFCTSTDHTFVFGARHLRELLSASNCMDVRSVAYHYPQPVESWHWRAYKGACRSIDRMLGQGLYQLAVARRAS